LSLGPGSALTQGALLWTPSADWIAATNLTRYMTWLKTSRGLSFTNYTELWHWSVADISGFWASMWTTSVLKALPRTSRYLASADAERRMVCGRAPQLCPACFAPRGPRARRLYFSRARPLPYTVSVGRSRRTSPHPRDAFAGARRRPRRARLLLYPNVPETLVQCSRLPASAQSGRAVRPISVLPVCLIDFGRSSDCAVLCRWFSQWWEGTSTGRDAVNEIISALPISGSSCLYLG